MKHKLKITLIILALFIVTQFIGLYVVSQYAPQRLVNGEVINVSSEKLPYGMDTPTPETSQDYGAILLQIAIAFILALSIVLFLAKFNFGIILKIWFFIVVTLALSLTFNIFFRSFPRSALIAFIVALPLAILKVFKRNYLIHNLTELVIYPGIAAVFVPILNVYTIIILLIIISIYDMWAVWRSGIMQKMAKYQAEKLGFIGGLFIPYLSKKQRSKIKAMDKKQLTKLRKKGMKVNVAVLGGGDIVFPIIASGVVFIHLGGIYALGVIIGATIGLSYLLFKGEKKKFYPAMPFITTGIFLGMGVSYLVSLI